MSTISPERAGFLSQQEVPVASAAAVRMVWEAWRAGPIPICGVGGVETGEDADIPAGATAVSVGSANS